jgi:PadR family transcriptional regulator, regulatory protein PadR
MMMSDQTVTPDPLDPTPADGPDAQARKFQRELSAGLTSLVLLSVLAEATGDLYGYEIARRLTGDGERASPFKQGALYPVLRNMSAAGLLSSRVVPSYSGPPRRYYRITSLGHDVLQSWRASWQETRAFVDSIVQPSTAPETTP